MKKLLSIAFASLAVAAMAEGETQFSPVIGVTKITTTNKLTIISVPFASLNGGGNISVKDLVSGKGLPNNTWAYVFADNAYTAWQYTTSGGWVGAMGGSNLGVETPAAATESQTIASPGAIWIQLPDAPSTSQDIYIIGNFDTPPTSQTLIAGSNLVANPLQSGGKIAIETAVSGDQIVIPNDVSPETFLCRTKSGHPVWVQDGAIVDLTNKVIPAGQGFWYIRKAGAANATISWVAAE